MNERLWAQMEQRFASEVFWHFVGRDCKENMNECYKRLIGILKNGLKVGSSPVEFKFKNYETRRYQTLYGYPVSCLSDIPFKDLHIHAKRYGAIAIGFHKDSVIKNHFNPVLYTNKYSGLFLRFLKKIVELQEYLEAVDKKKFESEFLELFWLLGALAKSGDIKANPTANQKLDKFQLNNFYYEREWRSIYNWQFTPSDIAIIIVFNDKMVERLKKDIKDKSLRVNKSTPIVPFQLVYRL